MLATAAATAAAPVLALVPKPAPSLGGFTVRFVKQYEIGTAHHVTRYDVLYGFAVARPEFACRVLA